MNYSGYHPIDFLNGEGVRCSLFVSGCSHGCIGCQNEKTWHPKFGDEFTKEVENMIIRDLQDTHKVRQGITLSGGDPLFKNNVPVILALMKRIKEECPGKDIWMWTGYTKEELEHDDLRKPVLSYVDVLVDGKFQLENRDVTLKWRGSPNQRVIYLKQP